MLLRGGTTTFVRRKSNCVTCDLYTCSPSRHAAIWLWWPLKKQMRDAEHRSDDSAWASVDFSRPGETMWACWSSGKPVRFSFSSLFLEDELRVVSSSVLYWYQFILFYPVYCLAMLRCGAFSVLDPCAQRFHIIRIVGWGVFCCFLFPVHVRIFL